MKQTKTKPITFTTGKSGYIKNAPSGKGEIKGIKSPKC